MRSSTPIPTAHGKLIRELLNFISIAVEDIEKGNPRNALIELEYAQLIANESLQDNQELRECFYTRPTCLKKCLYEK